jgi:uncharacterized protein (DUF433 family)
MLIAVADVLGWLAAGQTYQQILDDFPELTDGRHPGLPGLCRRP